PLSAADGDLAEVRPVDLRLLAGQDLAADECVGGTTRAHPAHDGAEAALRARVAACNDHRPKTARPQPRMLRERRLDEWNVRIHEPGALHLLRDGEPAMREHAFDRVVVTTELARDRADRPSLDVM